MAKRTPLTLDEEVRVGAFGAIKDEVGRVLLVHRFDLDYWCLPGGMLEFGESVAECVVRECREETSLEVEVRGVVGVYSLPERHTFDYPGNRRIQWVTIVVEAAIIVGEPRADGVESRAVEFFDAASLPLVVRSHSVWINDALAGARRSFLR